MSDERKNRVEIEVSTQEAKELFDKVSNKLQDNLGLQASVTERFLTLPHVPVSSIDFESGGEGWRLCNSRDSHSDHLSLIILGSNRTEGIDLDLRYKAEPGGRLILEDNERVVDSFTLGHHIIDLEKEGDQKLDQVVNDQDALGRIRDFISKL